MDGGQRERAARLCASIALSLASAGCDPGGVVDAEVCGVPHPSPAAFARINDSVAFDGEGRWHVVSEGGTGTVLPGGRLLTPMGRQIPDMGYPISVVTNPNRAIAYVADMGAAAYNDRCSPAPGVATRGIHVVAIDSGLELQAPQDVPLPSILDGGTSSTVTGCPLVYPMDAGGDAGIPVLPHDASYGLAINKAGTKLYTSSGVSGYVYVYAIAADGRLTGERAIYVNGYTAGLGLSSDESHLWVVQFLGQSLSASSIVPIDVASETAGTPIALTPSSGQIVGAYGVASVQTPMGEQVYVTGFRDGPLVYVDPVKKSVTSVDDIGKNPEAVLASRAGDYVFVTSSDDDFVYAVPTAGGPSKKVRIGEDALSDQAGNYLPGSAPTALALDEAHHLLYVARAADNAVAVVNVADPGGPAFMSVLGSVPVGYYPTSLALIGNQLVVANGKGVAKWVPEDGGTITHETYCGDTGYNKIGMPGTLSVPPLPLDIASGTPQVIRNIKAPDSLEQFDDCGGAYPVPGPSGTSPIQHIVLVVRENKTYDFLLGGESEPEGAEYQIDHLRHATDGCDVDAGNCVPPITPNIRNIAKTYAFHDNFYANSEVSSQGHAWLTASFVNDYVERAHLEEPADGTLSKTTALASFQFGEENGFSGGEPGFGTFFTHLIKNGVPFVIMGEAVGALGHYGDDYVANYIDFKFPFFDLGTPDDKRVAEATSRLVDSGDFPAFVYLELMRDHTMGLSADMPTPEAMIAENDAATGKLIEALSHSAFWPSTAVFIVEDDPQMGFDHIDYHRTICVVASPWVQPGAVSHVNTSFPSLFRTFELILGIPPMNRFDAYAVPLRDVFQASISPTTYTGVGAAVPIDETNKECSMSSFASSLIDFSKPDTSPLLGDIIWQHFAGSYPPGSRVPKVAQDGKLPVHSPNLDDK